MTGRRRHRQAPVTAFFAPAKTKDAAKTAEDLHLNPIPHQLHHLASTEPTLTPPSPPVSSPEQHHINSLPSSPYSVPEQPSSSVPPPSVHGAPEPVPAPAACWLPPLPPHSVAPVHNGFSQCTLTGCDIPPSRVCYVTIPFKQCSIPPAAPPVNSPVTPEQVREQQTLEPVLYQQSTEPPSRLCRSRNLSRRLARKQTELQEEQIESDESSEPPVTRPKKKRKPLHPFFANAAAAVTEVKEKKRPRVVKTIYDAWSCISATVHVNLKKPAAPWCSPLTLAGADVQITTAIPGYVPTVVESEPVRKAVAVANVGPDLWVEKYKVDKRMDVVSASVTKGLVDWLRPWYSKPKRVEESDDDSLASWVGDELEDVDRQRIAVLQGGVGCGKSTVVMNAARQLGLTILEINASVCRAGKKVRDIVQEALRTHRVAGKSESTGKAGGVNSAKTLILFEEVDELHEDERGFWHTVQELTASSECRRPIVFTVNKFNADLKMNFMEEKGAIKADLERLFVGAKEELINNPLPYKHLSFTRRTEKQVSAVLNRVIEAEQVTSGKKLAESLAVLCRDDSRKAINMLHFWGLKGLSNEKITVRLSEFPMFAVDEQANRALRMISGMASSNISSSVFWTAAKDYTVKLSASPRKSSRLSKRKPVKEKADTLAVWSETLNLMSYVDTVDGMVNRKMTHSAAEVESFTLDVHYDADIRFAVDLAEDLDMIALHHARNHILFDSSNECILQLARDVEESKVQQNGLSLAESAVPRRAVFSEYLPTLRTMAQSYGTSATQNGLNGDSNSKERSIRRTRSSVRKGGFAALDLDTVTVSDLQKCCLRG